MIKRTYNSPIGLLGLAIDGDGRLVQLHFLREGGADWPDPSTPLTVPVERQLDEYFAGSRHSFDLELAPRGTPFQRQVWDLLSKIPYGETRSYGQLASALGNPGASRAVGRANATNPIAIVVPCHRVIGANGSLTGFAGGLSIKEKLLALEQGSAAALFG